MGRTVANRNAQRERNAAAKAKAKATTPSTERRKPQGFQPGNQESQLGVQAQRRGRPMTQMLISRLHEAAGKGNVTKMGRIIEKLVASGMKGDMDAIKFIFERVDGKVPLAITGEDGGPVTVAQVVRVFVDAASPEGKTIDVTPGLKDLPPQSTRKFVDPK